MYCSYWTWTQSGASYFLNALALAEGTTVEWGRIGAGPRTLLKASPASAVTHWPLSPGRPASIHWKAREKAYDSISKPPWSSQRYLCLCVMLPPTAVTSDGWEEHEKQRWTDTNPCLQRTECTACQKPLYKLKKCWRWMTNTIWWLLGLAGDLPSPWQPTRPRTKAYVRPKSLWVQRAPTALPARSLHSDSCTIFQREVPCTPAHSQL